MKTILRTSILRFRQALLLALAALLALGAAPALAQGEQLIFSIHRDFGYGSGNEIRGTFTVSVRGREDLQSVTFLIDGEPMGQVTAAPWKLQFKTTDYEYGEHVLSASAVTTAGETIASDTRSLVFATGGQEMAGVRRVIGPILGLVGGLIAIMMLIQFVAFRKTKGDPLPLGAPRRYGVSGGAICPKCHRPFPLHWWSLNLGFHKYDRCMHCGKAGLFRPASPDDLARAEKAELEWGKPQLPVKEQNEADHLRDELDSSRYLES